MNEKLKKKKDLLENNLWVFGMQLFGRGKGLLGLSVRHTRILLKLGLAIPLVYFIWRFIELNPLVSFILVLGLIVAWKVL